MRSTGTRTGKLPFDDVMARYQRDRDEAAMPMFELTCLFANLEEPHPLVARGEAVLSETVQLIRST